MLNAESMADISSVSPLSKQLDKTQNISQHIVYGVQHIHINLLLKNLCCCREHCEGRHIVYIFVRIAALFFQDKVTGTCPDL